MLHASKRNVLGLMLLLVATSGGIAMGKSRAGAGDPTVLSDQGFINAHPDLRFRLHGMAELKASRGERALAAFKRAALYADKPSQAMIATQYWEGQGIGTDRALGYAWMDLAAERGYPDFLLQRERYWAALDQAERKRALQEGASIYARYGDDVAKPRIDKLLRRAGKLIVGSRTGFAGSSNILLPMPGSTNEMPNYTVVTGSQFYAPKFWKPEQYHAWHDQQWEQPRMGRVEVGELVDTRVSKPTQAKREDEAKKED